MTEGLSAAQIVLIGEIHDNPEHHARQARIVADLQPDAIVFEMIGDAAARSITPDLRANAVALEAALDWSASGWPDFAMYYPIFVGAPEAAIYGAALSRETVRQAVSDGAAATFGDAASAFALDQPLPEAERDTRVALQREAHCGALPEEILPGMVEAQRLRDAALARATVAAFAHAEAVSDAPQVVVIAGNGHVREDWGVPAMLRAYYGEDAPGIATLGQFEAPPEAEEPFLLTATSDPPEREDPCLAFAK